MSVPQRLAHLLKVPGNAARWHRSHTIRDQPPRQRDRIVVPARYSATRFILNTRQFEPKATHGGTIGRAKLGYLNTKTDIGGKKISTVILDPERFELVRKAWELYATGDYGFERLEAAMADLGLTARPSARNPHIHPVSANKLDQMLGDPYYLGYVIYKGDIYPGNHEPLVDEELFQRVQEVRDLRSAKGQRDRVHQHYLKGGLFCQRCHLQDRTSRLIFTQPTGRAGKKYGYFVCRGRQDGYCDLPHLRIEDVEDAIIEHSSPTSAPSSTTPSATNKPPPKNSTPVSPGDCATSTPRKTVWSMPLPTVACPATRFGPNCGISRSRRTGSPSDSPTPAPNSPPEPTSYDTASIS
ncbi:recombinase family protein [Nocardia farcinica]|uniref:recombinase family protein n=1 Tax=Nocardia farcinica TaxID=37329 RepID=UPI0022BA0760|nr:recombinase family protein [Nocardia farcinica]MCZ9328977.1 recombinase family protein [Nocardia farcinica]